MGRPVDKDAKNLGYSSITIRLDQDTIDKLSNYCEKKGIVRSEFVRKIILDSIQN